MEYNKRHIHDKINAHLNKKEYTIITGARQVGKTTLLRQFYKELKKAGKKVFYLSLENIDVLNALNEHPEKIFQFTERPINPLETDAKSEERIFLLLDEVQYANDPSGFLKYLFDTYLSHLKIIATGSSAFYIDRKFKDSLAGRKKIFHLHPLNFQEYLEFSGKKDLSDEVQTLRERKDYFSLKKQEIKEYFDDYLIYGGYPAVVLENDSELKKEILLELRDSYIKRDILESGIRNDMDFYNLMKILAGQTGNLVNKNELSKTLRIHLSTIENYLSTLEKCFHISLVKPFYKNLRKEIVKMPKVYFNDLGLRNALLNRFSGIEEREDTGVLLENYVYQRLVQIYPQEDIKFWRTADGNEVDFVVSSDYKNGKAYEVKSRDSEYKPTKYKKFTENYPNINLSIIAYNSRDKNIPIIDL
ncbi:MAG: ATP-binding protein [Bacteroidales bacterium]|nr:ATP-binding protein [Bacteroidales bacterium]